VPDDSAFRFGQTFDGRTANGQTNREFPTLGADKNSVAGQQILEHYCRDRFGF